MALKKSIELPSGVSGEYNRISIVQSDNSNNKIYVNVELYLDHASRSSGKAPLKQTSYCLDYPQLKTDELNIIEKAYELLKLESDFSGAIDD